MTDTATEFVDFYELLQLSPNADADTIQRVFRLLAQRYHPDNKDTGNEPVFQQLLKAYHTLCDAAARAAYDAAHRQQARLNWKTFDQTDEPNSKASERKKRESILGILYRKRQFSPAQPGMNVREMEDVLGIAREHLEFALWFLKEKGELKTGDNGRYIITIQGAISYEGQPVMSTSNLPEEARLLPAARNKGY
ncbi:MAG: DnaJ domain-containing protein [Acidobacteria bacterium]|nr:DnaJ domain-containing protein [Acidobacteriota bacterium]